MGKNSTNASLQRPRWPQSHRKQIPAHIDMLVPEGGLAAELNVWHDARGIPAVRVKAGAKMGATIFAGVF